MTVSFKHPGEGDNPTQEQPTEGATTPEVTAGEGNADNSGGSNTEPVLEFGGRKYTPEELQKKIASADEHIKRIEEENKSLREAAERGKNIDEVLEQLRQKKGGDQEPTKDEQMTEAATQNPELTPEHIEQLIDRQIAEREAKRQAAANWDSVTRELTNRFGNEVDTVVQKVAEENGFSLEEAKAFAQSHPQAFLKLVPQVPQGSTPSPTGSDTNTRALGNGEQAKPGHEFWNARTDKGRIAAFQARLQALSN